MSQEKSEPPARLFEAHDLLVAVAMATRLPVPVDHARAGGRVAASAWAAPLVGVLVGAAAAAAFAAARALGLSAELAAWMAIATQLILTGALHEDGLADSADGLGAGGDPERIRAAMRDSRIGVFGAAALIVLLGARAGALGALETAFAALIASGALSRAVMVVLWAAAPPPTGADGLAARAGRPRPAQALVAVALGGGAAFLATGEAGEPALIGAGCALVFSGGFALYARRRVGALTGDLLGAVQAISELCVLLAFAASVAAAD